MQFWVADEYTMEADFLTCEPLPESLDMTVQAAEALGPPRRRRDFILGRWQTHRRAGWGEIVETAQYEVCGCEYDTEIMHFRKVAA